MRQANPRREGSKLTVFLGTGDGDSRKSQETAPVKTSNRNRLYVKIRKSCERWTAPINVQSNVRSNTGGAQAPQVHHVNHIGLEERVNEGTGRHVDGGNVVQSIPFLKIVRKISLLRKALLIRCWRALCEGLAWSLSLAPSVVGGDERGERDEERGRW